MMNDTLPTLSPLQLLAWVTTGCRRPGVCEDPSPRQHFAPPNYPLRLPSRFQPAVVARAAVVLHLRERQHLKFREISKLLHYEGPGKARDLYSRACTLRRLFTSELPPDIKAAWRLQLLSAFDLDPTPEQDLPPDR